MLANSNALAEPEFNTPVTALKSSLISKNITVRGHRTSIRLEPEMWDAIKDIANRERTSIHYLCTLIAMRKQQETSLTAAIRVFLMLYYRAAATSEGHARAGHGNFDNMLRRAKIDPPSMIGQKIFSI
jgi:predicted DNA-binding ribbon-helix-helix protein